MKIIDVRTIPFAIPYRKPLHFASGHIDVADNVLVEVVTEDGITGVAEAPPRPYTYGETQVSIVHVINAVFGPAVTGVSLLAREQVRERLSRTVGNPTAKAAIDMAMWDAWGKMIGAPVHEMLGGYTDRLQVSHMLGFAEPAAMAEEALRMRDEFGITSFKIKVGRRPIGLDLAVCRAIHDAIGREAELYLDGNRGWTAAEAARVMRELADLNLSRVEELCPADDVLARHWLVKQCPIPFVADESAPTPADATRELLAGAANALSIKTARTGFSGSLRVAHLAEGLGVPTVIGNQIDGQIGSACSLAFGVSQRSTAREAAELSNYLDMSDDLLTEPLRITAGSMRVRPGPGLGIEVDQDKLDHYRTDR
ncbi:L-alanine-DL-glutamate epimerase-like enolase superfamily enzyme [Saccharopolyspora lacisalsi]|uniref:L-alanine-DL-glutamate epimerase-like enolase superfamily enzyme n=1 Tax=Halosaccharopolyspora lacisalsi TaxID=1000566 RepID=A0A839DXC6_9PSEU|nr:enolase C-terminal domain-like protein [Halosaccharopolyspora lacisalsi]MBA8824097.1 L-alanine-DL-glutamate epimerase-like enolase superfamily enzyme [Halosaccharopolyspora lacisalsi]